MNSKIEANVGREARWIAPNLMTFTVRITDAKIIGGTLHYFVTPVAGDGIARIRATQLRLLPEEVSADG